MAEQGTPALSHSRLVSSELAQKRYEKQCGGLRNPVPVSGMVWGREPVSHDTPGPQKEILTGLGVGKLPPTFDLSQLTSPSLSLPSP